MKPRTRAASIASAVRATWSLVRTWSDRAAASTHRSSRPMAGTSSVVEIRSAVAASPARAAAYSRGAAAATSAAVRRTFRAAVSSR